MVMGGVWRVNVENRLHENRCIIRELMKILHKKRKSEETSIIRETWAWG